MQQTFGFQSKNTVKVFEPTEFSDDALLENSYNCLAISYSKLKLFATYNRQLSVLSLPTLSKSIENPALTKNDLISDQHEFMFNLDYDALQIYLNFDNTILYLLTVDGKIIACDVDSLLTGELNTTVFDFTEQILRFYPSSESDSVLILTKSNKLLLLKDQITPLLENIGSVNWLGLTDSAILYSCLGSNEVITASINDITNHIDVILIELDEECPEIVDFEVFNEDKFVVFTCDQLKGANSQISYIVNNKTIRKTDNIFNMFSMVDRLTSFYCQLLPKWSESYPELLVGLSSKSEEISVLTPDVQLDLLNDQDMATLPLFDDNDSSAIGFTVDITSTEKVVEPCKGIDESGALPRVYILNNYGQLVSWNIWSSVDIRNNKTSLDNCLKALRSHRPTEIKDITKESDHQKIDSNADEVDSTKAKGLNDTTEIQSSNSLKKLQILPDTSSNDDNMPLQNDSAKTATSFSFKAPQEDSNKYNVTPFGSGTMNTGSNSFGSTGFGSIGFNSSAASGGFSSNLTTTSSTKPFLSSQGGFGSFASQTSAFGKVGNGSNSLFSTNTKSSNDTISSPFGQLSTPSSIFKEDNSQKQTLFGQPQATSIFDNSISSDANPFSQLQQKSVFANDDANKPDSYSEKNSTSVFNNPNSTSSSGVTNFRSALDNINTESNVFKERSVPVPDHDQPKALGPFVFTPGKVSPGSGFGNENSQTNKSDQKSLLNNSTSFVSYALSDSDPKPKFSFNNETNVINNTVEKLETEILENNKNTSQSDLDTNEASVNMFTDEKSEKNYIPAKNMTSKDVIEKPNVAEENSKKPDRENKKLNENFLDSKSMDKTTSGDEVSIDRIEYQDEGVNVLGNMDTNDPVTKDENSEEASSDNGQKANFESEIIQANLNDSDFELVERHDPIQDSYALSDEDSLKDEESPREDESLSAEESFSEDELAGKEELFGEGLLAGDETKESAQFKAINTLQSKYIGTNQQEEQKKTIEKHKKVTNPSVEMTTASAYVDESVDATTSAVEYVKESIEVFPDYINDKADCGNSEDHTTIAFEGEESYLSKFYIPKSLPLLTARGKITYPEDIDSYPTIGKEIMKIVYDIEAEFLVLDKNVQNFTDYLLDQNSNKIMQHTLENSSEFPSHWRFCEADTVACGIEKTSADYKIFFTDTIEIFDKTKSMHKDVFFFAKRLVFIGLELKDIENEFKADEKQKNTLSRSLSLEETKQRESLRKKALLMKGTYERLSQCVLILNSQLHPEKIISPQFEFILSSIQKAIHHAMDNIQDLKIELKTFTHAGKSGSTDNSSAKNLSLVLDEKSVKLQMERIIAREARKKTVRSLIKQIPFAIQKLS